VNKDDVWVRVGDAARWVKGRGRQVDVAGTAVAVFWDGQQWIAVADTCPHMGASLADGRLIGSELQCSWHEWRYDTTTGQCPLRSWARVRVYETKVEAGGVWIKGPGEAPPVEPASDDDPEWLSWDPKRYFK
jgi:nitrite reductase (NADH) small subunit/3-phenylpropionate/trans-cinnamate dioxygenase ferredoxin subunit